MDNEKLSITLELHKLWLEDNRKGQRAELRDAFLEGADLRHADLRLANLQNADLQYADLRSADLRYADLRNADLRHADLRHADLKGADLLSGALEYANLLGADLDYSVMPLWCGSLYAQFDDRQLRQIAYHLVQSGLNSKNASAAAKAELAKLIDFANQFHRAQECGEIKIEKRE